MEIIDRSHRFEVHMRTESIVLLDRNPACGSAHKMDTKPPMGDKVGGHNAARYLPEKNLFDGHRSRKAGTIPWIPSVGGDGHDPIRPRASLGLRLTGPLGAGGSFASRVTRVPNH